MYSLARILLFVGIVSIVMAGFVYLMARSGLSLGSLPGNFRFQVGNMTCFIPLAASILLSVILTILLNVLLRIVGRK